MKKLLSTGIAVLALLSTPLAALAESTTGTSFTVEGQPVPGGQVIVHVTVTGKHLVFVPPQSVNGGYLQVSVNGAIVASVEAALANSTSVSQGQCIPDPTLSFCVTYKFPAQQTDIAFPVTLPQGVSTFQIGARYTGDADSHSSDAVPVSLRAVYPSAISASISLLLD